MGNLNSMCESFVDKTPILHKSSLNLKYIQDKRNTGASSNKSQFLSNKLISKGKRNKKRSTPNSSIFDMSPRRSDEDQSTRASKKGPTLSVEDFHLIKVLGRGSYGKIYLVQKKSNNKYYALKTIKKQDLMRGNLRQTVFTERNVLKQSQHPFIVNLKYSFQTEMRIYMVMEFCQGGELYLHLRKQGKFNEDEVRFYLSEVVLALQYLHETLNIIHRDLKPENILVCADGHIKVTDFGLAKVSNKAHSICGTPEYLAPEIILRQSYGKAIDWWSLGCFIYEMYMGYPPFSSKDREELNDDIILKRPELPEGMPEDLEDLITRLLSKDPKARLGAKGAEEVKQHPFFKDVNWEAVMNKEITPPYLPMLSSIDDVSHFHKSYVNEPVYETPLPKNQFLDDPKNDFPSFSYLEETFNGLRSTSHIDKEDDEENSPETPEKNEKVLNIEF